MNYEAQQIQAVIDDTPSNSFAIKVVGRNRSDDESASTNYLTLTLQQLVAIQNIIGY